MTTPKQYPVAELRRIELRLETHLERDAGNFLTGLKHKSTSPRSFFNRLFF